MIANFFDYLQYMVEWDYHLLFYFLQFPKGPIISSTI